MNLRQIAQTAADAIATHESIISYIEVMHGCTLKRIEAAEATAKETLNFCGQKISEHFSAARADADEDRDNLIRSIRSLMGEATGPSAFEVDMNAVMSLEPSGVVFGEPVPAGTMTPVPADAMVRPSPELNQFDEPVTPGRVGGGRKVAA